MVSIPSGSSLGRYTVVEQLGRGGMATVFRAHDPTLDRYVAVKVLPSYHTEDPTFVGRFAQEAQTIARLSHPNILQIYDFGDDKGFTYIVSELVPGGDLQDKLREGPLRPDAVLEFMVPLAEALDYAHGQGIVHRDLKPANVLLDADSRPILADFGLARMLESSTRFTQASQALGTPEYMAPEQAMGADADHRSDLYAFGIMLFQMLLGQTPYRADTPAATLMAHVHRPLPLPSVLQPDIEPALEATLLKALAKDPDDRFQSAREMVQSVAMATGRSIGTSVSDEGSTAVMDIDQVETGDRSDVATAVMGPASIADAGTGAGPGAGAAPPRARPEPKKAAAPRPGGRRPWLLAGVGAAVVGIVVAVVAVVALSGGGDPEPTSPESADAPPIQAAPSGAQASTGAAPAESLAVVVETPTPEPTPAPVISLAEAVAALGELTSRAEENVHKLREVSPEAVTDVEFRTREQLAAITEGFFRRDTLRDQVFERQELYKVLDLMEDAEDLEDILIDIQLQQVYALFDDESEVVYVLSDATNIGPAEELGYVSAYLGSIQQGLFNISELRRAAREGGSDQFRAVTALIGGDVAQVATGYITTVFT